MVPLLYLDTFADLYAEYVVGKVHGFDSNGELQPFARLLTARLAQLDMIHAWPINLAQRPLG